MRQYFEVMHEASLIFRNIPLERLAITEKRINNSKKILEEYRNLTLEEIKASNSYTLSFGKAFYALTAYNRDDINWYGRSYTTLLEHVIDGADDFIMKIWNNRIEIVNEVICKIEYTMKALTDRMEFPKTETFYAYPTGDGVFFPTGIVSSKMWHWDSMYVDEVKRGEIGSPITFKGRYEVTMRGMGKHGVLGIDFSPVLSQSLIKKLRKMWQEERNA